MSRWAQKNYVDRYVPSYFFFSQLKKVDTFYFYKWERVWVTIIFLLFTIFVYILSLSLFQCCPVLPLLYFESSRITWSKHSVFYSIIFSFLVSIFPLFLFLFSLLMFHISLPCLHSALPIPNYLINSLVSFSLQGPFVL